jgi:type IV pilus assembly protein PilV
MTRQAPNRTVSRSFQTGVGLIEVMIAVLVLSIGFLGVAALQIMSLSTNNSAMARSMATIDSYSILDAMRADRTNALTNNAYATTFTADNCPAQGATLATYQLNAWCTRLAADLGALSTTKGQVACTAASGACTVTITFDDSRASNAGVNTASQQTQLVTVTTQVVL